MNLGAGDNWCGIHGVHFYRNGLAMVFRAIVEEWDMFLRKRGSEEIGDWVELNEVAGSLEEAQEIVESILETVRMGVEPTVEPVEVKGSLSEYVAEPLVDCKVIDKGDVIQASAQKEESDD